jgi:nitroreductase
MGVSVETLPVGSAFPTNGITVDSETMEFEEVVRKRRMTRQFSPDPIPRELLDELLHAGTHAPSAGFTQGVDLVLLTSDEARSRFWHVTSDESWRDGEGSAGLLAAPAIVLPVADPDAYAERYRDDDKATSALFSRNIDAWPVPYWLVDAAYASMLVLLAATAKGLGALFFQLHAAETTVCNALGIPGERRLIGAIAIGYPIGEELGGSPSRRARRPFADVVHREGW